MDKFETELFTQMMDTADELQGCFIDGDAYSRTPSFEEWRRASKLIRKLTLTGYELQGYAKARRQFDESAASDRRAGHERLFSSKGGSRFFCR